MNKHFPGSIVAGAFLMTVFLNAAALHAQSAFVPQPHAPALANPGDRCYECLHPDSRQPLTRLEAQGFRGRPHVETPPGGCECGKPLGRTRMPNSSMYWPRPLSAHLEANKPATAQWLKHSWVPAVNAPFDRLQGYQGPSRYQRTDNGYCGDRFGWGRDPYGCVGQTRAAHGIYGSAAGVVGLGIRDPGAPIPRN
jgi:hypothetical protein